jgi:MFS family permease
VPAANLIGIIASGIIQGAGFGLCWPPLVARIITLAPAQETALAANAASTVQRIGYAVGAAATGIAANTAGLAEEANRATVQQAGFWIFAGFAPLLLAGLVFTWRFSARD